MNLRISLLVFLAGVLCVRSLFAQTPASSRPVPAVTWTSRDFSIGLDAHGLFTSLRNPTDSHAMEWIRGSGPAWGVPISREQGKMATWDEPSIVSAGNQANELRFERGNLSVGLKQSLGEHQITQQYTLTNTSGAPVVLAEGDFGIRLPLPDNYPDATTALTRRCNVNLWTGGSSSWIDAVRMGGDAPHFGLVLTDGALSAYSIVDRPRNSNDRGTFVVHPPATTIPPGQSIKLAWIIFWHDGWDDFFAKALATPGFVKLDADRYTIFPGQSLHITGKSNSAMSGATVQVNGVSVEPHITGNQIELEYKPKALGDQNVEVSVNGNTTTLRAFVSPEPMELIEARVRFLIDHQQKNAPGQAIDGAFLTYDNETGQMVLERTNDHNAGRERVGMGVLLASYLPRCEDAQLKAKITDSLNRYWKFVSTHLQANDGTVFNDTDDRKQRLYNYPWVAHLHLAMYQATHETRYLDAFVKTIRSFYSHGGQRFYPIGLPISDGLRALTAEGRTAEHDELLGLFRGHADRIVATGMAMPKSEVNYEQSIVAPACQILLETYLVTTDGKYRDAAAPFLTALLAFNGQQPDHHLNDVAIRHWDDYWFGKRKVYGDTFPQYWSTSTAIVLADEARIDPAHAEVLRGRAFNIVDNNLSLFTPGGAASCAYVYPLSVNDQPGRFYDPWANDQDWALVNYLLLERRGR